MKTLAAKAKRNSKSKAKKAKTQTATLPPNAFIGRKEKPTSSELASALGPTQVLWDLIIDGLAREQGVDVQEWNSYSPKAGWALRLKKKDRNVVYLAPLEGSFRVAFILGDKAVKAARQAKFPASILKLIADAPRYPEGTGVRMRVTSPVDVEVVKKLAAIKLEN